MAIPKIEQYALPTEADIPVNVVGWSVEPSRGALLVHDMQRYFVRAFPAEVAPIRPAITNMTLIMRRCRQLGMPIFYSAQPGGMTREDRGLLRDFWGDGMRVEPDDRQIIEELLPREEDEVLPKWRYSAFHRSPLERLLQEKGRDQLIVCGIYAHIGCLMTVCDAFTKDIMPFLVADAIADFNWDYHLQALTYAAERCAATPSTTQLLSQLAAGGKS
ncbi:isochorismatase family protein [Agrobacterium vitis]|uniref:isochorismatase family protein n=1 Tax=Agrobacterium vitis TaxID=373 RepID=UPI003D270206